VVGGPTCRGLDPGVLSAVRDRLIVFPVRWYTS